MPYRNEVEREKRKRNDRVKRGENAFFDGNRGWLTNRAVASPGCNTAVNGSRFRSPGVGIERTRAPNVIAMTDTSTAALTLTRQVPT